MVREVVSGDKETSIAVLLPVENRREAEMHFHSFLSHRMLSLHFSLLHAVSHFILNLLESSAGDRNATMASAESSPPARCRPYILGANIKPNLPGSCALSVLCFLRSKVSRKPTCVCVWGGGAAYLPPQESTAGLLFRFAF